MKLYKVKKSKIDNKGRGLYAAKDIKSGTKIINYIGKILTNKEVDESDKFDNKKPIYLFTLNKKYTLDGDFSWNTAGLINHSCDNNCDYEGKGLKIELSDGVIYPETIIPEGKKKMSAEDYIRGLNDNIS